MSREGPRNRRVLIAGCLAILLSGAMIAASGTRAATVEAPYDDWNAELPGFPSNTADSPRANCAGGADACIDRTIGEMWRRFHTVIPPCEHNNVFSLTYLRVTEDVRKAIDEDFYPDLHWINKQDAMFARTYFLSYDNWAAGRRDLVPESWRIAFDAGRDRTVEGIGNLLLSMNAHINRDFPFVLYHVGLTNPDGSSKKPEHDAYNERLRALYNPMLDELARRFDESINDYDAPGTTIDDDTFFSILLYWRETTWQNAVRLAEAESDAERRQVARSIEEYANTQARLIYAGSAYGPGESSAARDAQCAEHGGQRPHYPRGADVARPSPNATLRGGKLIAGVSCPNGIGPCAGALKIRRPRESSGGDRSRPVTLKRFPMLRRARFDLEPGTKAQLRLPLRGRQERLTAHPGRGVWLGARSKQAPREGTTRRVKARLRPAG